MIARQRKQKKQSNMACQVYQIAIPLLFLYKIVDCKIPLITWNVGEGYDVTPASIPSGKTIDIEHAYDKYLEETIGNNKVLLIFLQDELSIDDIIKYSASYQYLQRFNQIKKPLVLPSVNTKDTYIDKYLLKKLNGKVQHVYNEDINGWKFNKNYDVIVFHLEPVSGSTPEGKADILKANDELFHYSVKKAEKTLGKFGIIYTALEPSKVISQILTNEELADGNSLSKRHLLAANNPSASVVDGGMLFNGSNAVYLYVTSIKLVDIENGELINLNLSSSHGWSVRGSACEQGVTAYSISINTSHSFGGNITSFYLHFALAANKMSGWFCDEVTLKVNYKGQNHILNASCGGEIAKGQKIWPFSYPVEIIVPKRYSYACSNITFSLNDTYRLEISGMQLEPNPECSQGFKFSNGYNCVGFFSIGILSSLFVTFILAGGLFIGIMMMMSIQTPERFDDPKGPTITVPSTD